MKRTIKTTEEEFNDEGNLVKRVVIEEVEEDEPKADKPSNPFPNPLKPYTINSNTFLDSASSGNFGQTYKTEVKSDKTESLSQAAKEVQAWLDKHYNRK